MTKGKVRVAGIGAIFLLVAMSGCFGAPGDGSFELPPGVTYALPPFLQKHVDPVLREILEANQSAIAILAVDPFEVQGVINSLETLGIDHHLYKNLDMIAIQLEASHLEDVANLTGVEVVYRNEEMQLQLDRSAQYVGANVVHKTYKVTGRGVSILVVDSGVDGNHPDLQYGKVLLENAVPATKSNGLVGGHKEGVKSSDQDGHGTHVAGIVAGQAVGGSGTQGKFPGVAFGATLVGFKAGIDTPAGVKFESVTILEAFDYALAKQDEFAIRVVSNSWGANGAFDLQSPINRATFTLYKAGLSVTFAAGNEGRDGESTLTKYCVAPWVLCVAAGDYLNQRASFSSMGTDPQKSKLAYDHPDVMAPGVQIQAAKHGGRSGGDLYIAKSGTSMATPHISGIMALMLQANPDLSPDQVYDILVASSTPLPGMAVHKAGAGYVNALDAYKLSKDVDGNLKAFLSGKIKYGGPHTGDPQLKDDPVTVGLGQVTSRSVAASGVSFGAFVANLLTTFQGIVFFAGTATLALLAFRRRPKQ